MIIRVLEKPVEERVHQSLNYRAPAEVYHSTRPGGTVI